MTYSLIGFHPSNILRDADQTFIPYDPDNIDYQNYLAWLDAGNRPTPRLSSAMPFIETASLEARLDDLEARVASVEKRKDLKNGSRSQR